jgi:hypothetical protein
VLVDYLGHVLGFGCFGLLRASGGFFGVCAGACLLAR